MMKISQKIFQRKIFRKIVKMCFFEPDSRFWDTSYAMHVYAIYVMYYVTWISYRLLLPIQFKKYVSNNRKNIRFQVNSWNCSSDNRGVLIALQCPIYCSRVCILRCHAVPQRKCSWSRINLPNPSILCRFSSCRSTLNRRSPTFQMRFG